MEIMKAIRNMAKMIIKTGVIALILSFIFIKSASAATIEKIVAVVDGSPITMYELDEATRTMGPEIQKEYGVSGTNLRVKVLDELIDNRVMDMELKKSKLTVEPNEIDSFIDRILRSSRMSMEQFNQHLLEKGVSVETYRKQLNDQILKSKFVNEFIGRKISVTERELKEYFDKHMDEFKSASSVRLNQLSILFTPSTTKDDLQTIENAAVQIYREAATGSSFPSIAARHNSNKFKVETSDLGVVQLTDLQPQFAQIASMLQIGQVSQPIPTNTGLHLIKVIDRAQTSPKDFSSVRDQVNDVVYNIKVTQALKGYVKQLRRNARVDIKGL